jgi:TolB-like protein/Flp pilus assembly protein TadD
VNPKNFFAELKRRNVYKVAIAYAVVAWLLMQVASQIFPFFEIPNWAVRLVVLLLIIGFPVAMILAWAFELTPEGIKRTEDVDLSTSITRRTGRKLDFLIIGVLLVVVAILLFQRAHLRVPTPTSSIPEKSIAELPAKSIAVLPFENFSEDKAFAFFADGVQDEILTDLAKIADLKVISRTSVMQYKGGLTRNLPEIAQALKVAHVLEGSVQRSANRVRVSAQLIDARNDTHVWAEKYDRDLADVFAIQSEIAEKIADQLQAKLSPREKSAMNERPTSDMVAYDLYLRAKELIYDVVNARERENYFKAVQLLDQAIARDPAFLLAHCQLAYAHDSIYHQDYDHTEPRLALAETSVRAAVRLQPDSGETHLAQAIHFYNGYRNYDRAREELAKAQRVLPNNAQIFAYLAYIDRRQGRWEEAIRNLERAVDLDPQNQTTLGDLEDTYFKLRRYQEAIAVAYRALALQPRNAVLRAVLAEIEVEADANMAPLRATLNTIEAEGPASAAEVAYWSFQTALRERDPAGAARALMNIPNEFYIKEADYPVPRAWHEGLLAKLRQDAPAAHAAFMAARAETEKLVRAQPENERPLSALAFIDAELGDKEKAIQEGRTACAMLPPAKDAISGVLLVTNLARIYALTGEKDLALEQLDIVSKIPFGPSYGELRLDSEWDSLRGDPRFEKIVASLAPKPANR